MTGRAVLDPDTRKGLLASWCALWLVVGVWIGYEVWQLSALAESVADSGRALSSAGSALQSLGGIPVVGDSTGQLGQRVADNGADVVQSAGLAEESVRRLSVLLGLTIALVPSVPVVVLHRALQTRSRTVAER